MQNTMKTAVKILTWTVIISGIVALPFLIKRRADVQERRNVNVRYDVNDYLAELEA